MTDVDDWKTWSPQAKARLRWRLQARPNQLTPGTPGASVTADDWNIWVMLAGRGYGKTRSCAEDVASYAYDHENVRICIIAPTFGDARDICVEGESGLLNVMPQPFIKAWNRSLGELTCVNGSQFKLFSADQPERLRGPQHHRAWCEELAAWEYLDETWDMMMFGLRLGRKPQVVASTTPKPKKKIRELIARAVDPTDVVLTRGSTFENAANLAPAAIQELRKRYEGTRLGRQELNAEVLDEVEGALWNHQLLDRGRLTKIWLPETLQKVVVGIDPAITSGEDADATGIIVAGIGICRRCGSPPDPHAFVMADNSVRGVGPNTWARVAIRAYYTWKADRLVPEVNQGGEMVTLTLRTVDNRVNIKPVHASRGKQTRAEPVASLYEQGRVHHIGSFDELEDEMCTWEPFDPKMKSPDRMDALVWALTDLMLGQSTIRVTSRTTDTRLAGRR